MIISSLEYTEVSHEANSLKGGMTLVPLVLFSSTGPSMIISPFGGNKEQTKNVELFYTRDGMQYHYKETREYSYQSN